ncbi:MAG: hypothetical protein HY683_10555 [Chloroflexi bacterium]|nr:hypothetical protein [Chloroflexota bacterium]
MSAVHWKGVLAVFAVVVVGVVTIACGSSGAAQDTGQGETAGSLARVDGGQGGVTVEAIWGSPSHLQGMPANTFKDYPPDRYTLVHLKLDTHSVDLSQYNLARIATLSKPDGAETNAAAWISINGDSHHREGVLAFAGESNGMWETQKARARLTLKGIASVPQREFVWEF